jgi:hypothetical protein
MLHADVCEVRVVSKVVQFGAAGAFAFVAAIGGFLFLKREPNVTLAAATESSRALQPPPPWAEAMDSALLGKLADWAPELEAQGLWSCVTSSCGYVGRFLVLRGKAEFSDVQLRGLVARLAEPQKTSLDWPALPDSQAQALKFSDGVYVVVAQTQRAAGSSSAAGAAIDGILAKVIPAPKMAQAPKAAPPPPPPRSTGSPSPHMPTQDRDVERRSRPN